MSDFGGLALLCPQRMGAQFTRVQPRPPSGAIWTSITAQFGRPLLGDHARASCPSMARLGGRPSSGAHLSPRSATTWIHVNRPHGSTLGTHPAPRSASTSGQLGSRVRRPSPSTFCIHLRPPDRPLSAVRGYHNSHLRPPPHGAVRWPSKFRQPNGNPHPRFGPPPSCGWASNFRPRFGSQLGGHMSLSRFAPLHYAPSGGAILRPRIVDPRICGDKQNPHPKGVRAAW